MSATIHLFTGVRQTRHASKPLPRTKPAIPQFMADQKVWVIDHERDQRQPGIVFRQSGEWVQVRFRDHDPCSVHVCCLEAMEPEAA